MGLPKTLLGMLVTALLIPAIGIPLTLVFQLMGTFITFLIAGVVGGYVVSLNRFKGFLAGAVGSLLYIVFGMIIVVAIITFSLESVDLMRYIANYTLWLLIASPVNIVPLIVLISGLGGVFGQIIKEKQRKGELIKL